MDDAQSRMIHNHILGKDPATSVVIRVEPGATTGSKQYGLASGNSYTIHDIPVDKLQLSVRYWQNVSIEEHGRTVLRFFDDDTKGATLRGWTFTWEK